MKACIYLSLGALLLFLAPLGCSDTDNPGPETPPEEQPTPEPEKPEFVDANKSMEEYMKTEDPKLSSTYFRFQNATRDTIVFYITTWMRASPGTAIISPGEQGTWLSTMEKLPWIDNNDVLVKDLNEALAKIELFFNPIDRAYDRICYDKLDTCARYLFAEPLTEALMGSPRDQSAWVLEEFPDRPNAVRWTYRITEREYEEAVRQTLERWADRDEEEK